MVLFLIIIFKFYRMHACLMLCKLLRFPDKINVEFCFTFFYPLSAVFKSLLYEACGRIVNPVFGSTGLLSTGSWHLCEAAVKAVLSGAPIQQALDGAVSLHLQSCDIRHVAKSGKSCGSGQTRRFKRRAGELMKPKVDDSVSRDSGFGVSDHGSSDVVEADSNSRSVDEELELELTLGWGPLKRSRYTCESRDQGIDH